MLVREPLPTFNLPSQLAAMRMAHAAQGAPDAALRRAHLRTIERLVAANAKDIARAIALDFGHRSEHETALLEVFPTRAAARYARRNLGAWMAPERVAVAPYFFPGRARVVRAPAGVVGIMGAWNYPLLLAMGPLIGAVAAGNRVLVKTSEHAPRTAELLAQLIANTFASDHIAVVGGASDVGRRFAALPFDHLLFTGSTETGRSVMRAAAHNLTPVTLELGGKSPAIVGPDASLEDAAARIMSGKCHNAGQTCIAPDEVLVPEGAAQAFIEAAQRVVAKRYPDLPESRDYTSIVNGAQFDRLSRLLDDATAKGARVIPLHFHFRHADAGTRRMPPAIVIDVSDDMRIAHEEIFGPLLVLRTYRGLDDAIAYVNARPRPLALYYFGRSPRDIETVLERTVSGGVCVNDVMLQFAQEALPFGGIGSSGMGAYHGRAGFETFSHRKAVFEQAKRSGFALFEPPYGARFKTLLRLLSR